MTRNIDEKAREDEEGKIRIFHDPRSAGSRRTTVCVFLKMLSLFEYALISTVFSNYWHCLLLEVIAHGKEETDYQVETVCLELYLRVDVTCVKRKPRGNSMKATRNEK